MSSSEQSRAPSVRAQGIETRWFLAITLLLVVGCSSAQRPHTSVVVVVVDTLRADHLGAYGYQRQTSPNLDRWSEKGRLFERALSTSSWTMPSFGSLYTGLIPLRHGGGILQANSRTRPRRSVIPIAEHLKTSGIRTGAVVNNPYLGRVFGLDRGFMVYDHVAGDNKNSRRADEMVDRALALVDQWLDESFFLLVHFFDPHLDYDAPPPFRGSFSGAYESRLSLPVSSLGVSRDRATTLPTADKDFVVAAYDEEVAFMDEQFGRLLEALESKGVLDTTLVVFTSDHGEEFFEHGRFEHGHEMWQELLHIPLVFWGPDVTPGREPGPVSLVDVAPTILEWLGVEPLSSTDGISLWPNLQSERRIPERTLYAQRVLSGPPRSAIFRWPVKVVADASFQPIRAIDLDADPLERNDWSATDSADVSTLVRQHLTLTREVAVDYPTMPQDDAPELDEETLERLRSLGYIR